MRKTRQDSNLADEELSRLLEAANLTKSYNAGTEAMGLLDSTGSGSTLTLSLSELSARFQARFRCLHNGGLLGAGPTNVMRVRQVPAMHQRCRK